MLDDNLIFKTPYLGGDDIKLGISPLVHIRGRHKIGHVFPLSSPSLVAIQNRTRSVPCRRHPCRRHPC